MTKSIIADTYGEAYLGVVLAGILYGITVVQTYIYLDKYTEDRWAIRLFVIYIFILDTVHQASITYALWHYLIDSFGNPFPLLVIHWSLDIYFIISIVVGFSVQMFYTYRIWVLTRNRIICASIVAFGVVYLFFGAYFGRQIVKNPLWAAIPQHTLSTDISLACSIVADIIIAATMTLILRRRSTEFDRTRSVVQKMIGYAVGTGLLTVIMSLVTLILFATSRTFISDMLYFMCAKFYANAALISLNARGSMRAELRKIKPLGSTNSQFSDATRTPGLGNHSINAPMQYPPAVVNIQRTTTSDFLQSREDVGLGHIGPFGNRKVIMAGAF